MTKHLIEHGFRVTAVDNSDAMLAHVPSRAERVLSDIESLDLGAHFDAVLLASCLINAPGSSRRAEILAACFRHLRPGGRFIFERYDPDWLAAAREGHLGSVGEIELSIDRLTRRTSDVEISLRSRAGHFEWVQHFVASSLGDAEVSHFLVAAGFSSPSWIDARWGYADKDAV
jgi:SAM-dependent methyltransferase